MLESVSAKIPSSPVRTSSIEESNVYPQRNNDVPMPSMALQREEQQPTKKRVAEVVTSMNTFLKPAHTSVRFEYHEELDEYFVKVVDDSTQETVREIPPKKLLDFYAAMTEFVGLMVDKKI